MRTVLFLFVSLFISSMYAQIDNFNEILTNQNEPGNLQLVDNFLYVLDDESVNLRRFNLNEFPLTEEVVYTLPTPSDPNIDNVLNDFLVVGNTIYLTDEEFDVSQDMGLGSTIFSLEINDNTSTITEIIDTGAGAFISSLEIIDNMIYFTADRDIDDSYYLFSKDLSNLSATEVMVASTNGEEINDMATDGSLLYLANRDTGEVHYYDPTSPSSTLNNLSFNESINFIHSLEVQNNRIYIASGNSIESGEISTNSTIDLFTNLENNFYEDQNNGQTFSSNFKGVTVGEDGVGYASLTNNGIIGQSQFFLNSECTGTSSDFEEAITSLKSPRFIEQLNSNELIVFNDNGVSRVNITTEAETIIYNKSTDEFITQILVEGQEVFFSSIFGFEDSNGDFTFDFGQISKIDLADDSNIEIYSSSDQFIYDLVKSGTDLFFAHEPSDSNNTDVSFVDKIDLANDSFVELNVDYNFFLESIYLLNDTFYIAEDTNLYSAPVTDLTDVTLLSNDTNFVSNISIDNNFIYYTQENSLKRTPVNFSDFRDDSEFIAFNATYSDTEEDGSVFCSSIDSFTIIDDIIYATLEMNDLVISIPNEVVTLNNNIFTNSTSNDVFLTSTSDILTVHNSETITTVDIYDLNGKLLISTGTNNSSIDITTLNTGIYIVIINNNTNLKFIKE